MSLIIAVYGILLIVCFIMCLVVLFEVVYSIIYQIKKEINKNKQMKTQIRKQEVDLCNPKEIVDMIRKEQLDLNEVFLEYSTCIVLTENNKKLIESQKEFLRMCDKWGLE